MAELFEPYAGINPDLVRVSNSDIQTFKSCRRKWYFASYLGLQKKLQIHVGPLKLGSRVHDALEQFYLTGENPCDVYNRLLRVDNQLFIQSIDAEDPAKVKKFNGEAELGRIMLEGYIEHLDETGADSLIEVVAAETVLSYTIPELHNKVELQGKIDLEVRRRFDGSLANMDHKTAVGFDPYYKFGHMSEQLMTYNTLEAVNKPDEIVDGGIYNLLKKVKRTEKANPPFYARIDVRFNSDMMNSFWIRTIGTLTDMMNVRQKLDEGADHRFVAYPKPRMDWECGMCPFYQLCTMVDDGSQADRFMDDMYTQGDPHERYKKEEN